MKSENLKKIILIVVLHIICHNSLANNQPTSNISGRILDKNTKSPISNVNVFLANTAIGAASDNMGYFKINDVPEGIYHLVFDCVGYETRSIEVRIIQSQSLSRSIELIPLIYSTENIQIIADKPVQWLEQLEIFTREFIGQSRNANDCSILNPEVLKFQIDSITNNLIGSSDSTVKIRNNALGYQLDVKLVQFEYDFNTNICVYEIYPRFKTMIPQDKEQLSEWIEERQKTFQGSLRHVLYLLTHDENTLIFRLFVLSGISEKIHVTRDILDCKEVANSSLLRISFSNFVGFAYYHYSDARENRMLRLDQGYAYIDTLGNIYGPITKRGIWSKERLADLLPYDYNPNE